MGSVPRDLTLLASRTGLKILPSVHHVGAGAGGAPDARPLAGRRSRTQIRIWVRNGGHFSAGGACPGREVNLQVNFFTEKNAHS